MKFLILAGGSGTRLWPLSRQAKPKQVQPFLDATTMLQQTWRRLRCGWAARDIFLSTTKAHLSAVRRQLPELKPQNTIVEPAMRNTAPAIGLAVMIIEKKFPREVVITINSDHHVTDTAAFLKIIKLGERAVQALPERLILLGVKPTYPETGYGYLKLGRELKRVSGSRVFAVESFTEKPDLRRARVYVRSWNYLWNSGMFLFYPAYLLKLYHQHAPRLWQGLKKLRISRGTSGEWRVASGDYARLPAESMDYAVVEKSRALAVLPADFGWADMGHWRTIYDILAPNNRDNVTKGQYLSIASQGNLVYSLAGKLVATVGVHDFVIIDTGDALLVCPKDRTQDVRHLVAELKARGMKKYL